MARDLPLWQPLEDYDAQAVTLDFTSESVEPYVPPYTAPAAGSVDLDFWGDYSPGESLDTRLAFEATTYRYQPPGAQAVDLDFSGLYTAPAAGSVVLAFGGEGADQDDTVPLSIGATLPGLLAQVALEARNTVKVQATLPQLVPAVQLAGDINVYRDPMAQAGDRVEQGRLLHPTTGSRYGESARQRRQVPGRYQPGDRRQASTRQPSRPLADSQAMRRLVAEQAKPRGRHLTGDNQALPLQGHRHRSVAEQAMAASARRGVLNHYLSARRRQFGMPYQQAAAILARHWGEAWQAAQWQPVAWRGPYEQATRPGPGITPPPEPPEPPAEPDWPPPLPEFYRGTPDLDFCRALPVASDLDLGSDPCAEPPDDGDVPIQRTYLVSNSASLTLVATGQALDASAISVAIDADSWAWELRATLVGETSIAAVRDAAQPCELEATLNGHTWRVVLDSWGRGRQFGSMATITLGARSLAAYLGAPHAAPRSYVETNDRTAQQLAEQELPLGWTLDWQIDDWLVDAGAWHYTNRTPIEAITAIAAAAGGVVQAHPSEPTLIVAPRYQAPHWAWSSETPDVTLPLDVLTRLGSDYRPAETLNGVYVSGETTGVLALVKRTGTAADRLGEMVVDPLVTRQAAARGRGIAVLSASGDQSRESLQLPVSADIAGLLATGQLVRVDPAGDDWRGLVRAVSIDAGLDGDGALTINQTAEVERHLEETA
ncbi:hypothetical protein [Halomonas cerina]|uniref:Uncharacterized protein n=1 Tax=Halomonas cerina TaxID=447424 RepID=A0A839VD41_9GAMM|nr:hypothetical protein [Halomonas cerina]MBB3192038.1 hypothetical protein [Halomonas cerina]